MKKRITAFIAVFLALALLAGCASVDTPAATASPQITAVATQPPLTSWGLGYSQSEYVSVNADFEWYVDQMNTGPASRNNCGPACVVMAAKWATGNRFSKSVEAIRDLNYNNGGWWYMKDLRYAFEVNAIPIELQSGVTVNAVKADIDSGRIVVLNIHTKDISPQPNNEFRVGKPYLADFGHFVIAKGYRVVDGVVFLEIYDPWSMGKTYADGTLVGKDRYYLADEVVASAQGWFDSMIAVSRQGGQ